MKAVLSGASVVVSYIVLVVVFIHILSLLLLLLIIIGCVTAVPVTTVPVAVFVNSVICRSICW